MVFMRRLIGHIPFESGTDDAGSGTDLVAGLEDLFEIVSGLENEKCVTSSQTAARKNEDSCKKEWRQLCRPKGGREQGEKGRNKPNNKTRQDKGMQG